MSLVLSTPPCDAGTARPFSDRHRQLSDLESPRDYLGRAGTHPIRRERSVRPSLTPRASVLGSFVYTPTAGTVLPAGVNTLSVTFTPNNTAVYATATATVQLTVNPASQTITFPAITAAQYA